MLKALIVVGFACMSMAAGGCAHSQDPVVAPGYRQKLSEKVRTGDCLSASGGFDLTGMQTIGRNTVKVDIDGAPARASISGIDIAIVLADGRTIRDSITAVSGTGDATVDARFVRLSGEVYVYWKELKPNDVYRQGLLSMDSGGLNAVCTGEAGSYSVH